MMTKGSWPAHAAILAGLGLVLSLAIALVSGRVVDLDLWHELALAREIVRLGYVPSGDLFAFTPTVNPSVNHEWGAGMIAYTVLQAAGGAGIMILNSALAVVALALALEPARRGGIKPALTAMAALPALALLARGFPPVRAQAYSYIFLAALLLMLRLDRLGSRRWVPLWLAVFVLWVNIHGSFVLAFAAVFLCAATAAIEHRRSLHLWALLPAMAALVPANPYGLAMYTHLYRTLTMSRPLIGEWQTVWQAVDGAGLIKMLAVTLPLFGYAVLRGKRELDGAAFVLMTAAAGCLHTKMLPYYAVAWLAYVPLWLGRTYGAAEAVEIVMGRKRLSQVVWATVMAGAAAGLVITRAWQPQVPDAGELLRYPVGPVEYLRDNRFSGNVMTTFNHGAYVIWKLYPAVRVSMDSRYDVAYPESLVYENERAFGSGRACSAYAENYGADAVIVERSAPAEKELAAGGWWPRVYRDREFSVYARPDIGLPLLDQPDRSFRGTLP
jgi:hypothetical protein